MQEDTVPANRPLHEGFSPLELDTLELRQCFELVAQTLPDLYAANAPPQLDHPVRAWWRAPSDLARLTSDAGRYTVFSLPPVPSIEEMRKAWDMVPPDLAERNLVKFGGVPQQVLDLALEVAGDAPTRYDRPHNIEAFLRTYTYALDLLVPPGDTDLVDYFLFDLQEGYCHYYASAMVVMAREVGVPARFVTGYAQGEYGYEDRRWIITAENGHYWVEVYFAGIGWVEFGPTAGVPGLSRPGVHRADRPQIPPLPSRGVSWVRGVSRAVTIGAAAAFLLGAAVLAVRFRPPWRDRDSGPADVVREHYARLTRWGGVVCDPFRTGQIPTEYGHHLSASLGAEANSSRWSRVRQAGADVGPEVKQLTGAFVRARYGPKPHGELEVMQTRTIWNLLRRHFFWLKLRQG